MAQISIESQMKLMLRAALLKDGFKEFTTSDWDLYAGAEPFEDGSDPIIKTETVEGPYIIEEFQYVFDNSNFSRFEENGNFAALDITQI
jgi:hypothetical protein